MPQLSGASRADSGGSTSPVRQTRYVIITPARDEEQNIERAIQAIIAQTVQPAEWIIVNDGSSDKTAEILDRFAAKYTWLRVFHMPNRGFREPGSGVIRAFNYGLLNLQSEDWEFMVKLDGDLDPAPDYFERCFEEFQKDPTLGVGGGIICHAEDGAVRPDIESRFHVRGATKIYNRACWEALGGLIPVPGWDTLDEVKANMLGWSTRSFNNIQLLHRRLTGSADGTWRNWFKNGRANYVTGYHPLFMMLKCLKRVRQRPYFLVAFALFCGFVTGYIQRVPQVQDERLIRYVRAQQVRRLLFQSSIWK